VFTHQQSYNKNNDKKIKKTFFLSLFRLNISGYDISGHIVLPGQQKDLHREELQFCPYVPCLQNPEYRFVT
jgi:hypothetical protein